MGILRFSEVFETSWEFMWNYRGRVPYMIRCKGKDCGRYLGWIGIGIVEDVIHVDRSSRLNDERVECGHCETRNDLRKYFGRAIDIA